MNTNIGLLHESSLLRVNVLQLILIICKNSYAQKDN